MMYGELSYTAATLPDGKYFWRVRTVNYLDIPSKWSASRYFTVDTAAPAAPALSLPADGASVTAIPTFSWAASLTATRYQFQYDDDGGFSPALTAWN